MFVVRFEFDVRCKALTLAHPTVGQTLFSDTLGPTCWLLKSLDGNFKISTLAIGRDSRFLITQRLQKPPCRPQSVGKKILCWSQICFLEIFHSVFCFQVGEGKVVGEIWRWGWKRVERWEGEVVGFKEDLNGEKWRWMKKRGDFFTVYFFPRLFPPLYTPNLFSDILGPSCRPQSVGKWSLTHRWMRQGQGFAAHVELKSYDKHASVQNFFVKIGPKIQKQTPS